MQNYSLDGEVPLNIHPHTPSEGQLKADLYVAIFFAERESFLMLSTRLHLRTHRNEYFKSHF